MNTFTLARKNLLRGLWTVEMIEKLVEKGRLTPGEKEELILEVKENDDRPQLG